jgi:hypothetical protein
MCAQFVQEDAEEFVATAMVDCEENIAHGVVKMKLATFCLDVDVRQKIGAIVRDMNVLIGEAYALANFHIIRKLSSGCTVAELPKIDRNLYYRCLVGISNCKVRKGTLPEDLMASIAMFEEMKPASAKRTDTTQLNQIIATTSITMATMAINHLWTNLGSRIKSYLTWKHPDLKRHLKLIVRALVNEPKTHLEDIFAPGESASKELTNKLQRAKAIAHELRAFMQLPNAHQYASNAHMTLPLYFKMLNEYEVAQDQNDTTSKPTKKRPKMFTLLPSKSGYTTSYVQFSTTAFLSLLKHLNKIVFKGDGRGMTEVEKKAVWARVCNLKLVETFGNVNNGYMGREFDNQITTDGCSVSILMTHKTSITCPKQQIEALERAQAMFKSNPETSVVGVDPGFSDVVTVSNREGNIKGYSSRRYYEKAKYNLSRRRTDAWNADTTEIVQSIPSNETTNADRYKGYLRAYLEFLPRLVKHRMDKGYRNMRFLRYCWKNKQVHEICNFIAPQRLPDDHVTIVGFGDWKGGHDTPISRRTSGPLQEIKMELRSRANVLLLDIDEFRTSITCHKCHGKLCNMKAAHTVRVNHKTNTRNVLTNQKVHKVLHCKSNECRKSHNHTTWNRDVNASMNILMLAMHLLEHRDRPLAFCRSQTNGKR